MCDTMEEVLENSDVIVVGNKAPEFKQALPNLRDDQIMIDLVRVAGKEISSNGHYQGICW
jgi:GDP-mannose 6-dehydrogenase